MAQQDFFSKFIRFNRKFAQNWELGVGMLLLGFLVFFIPPVNFLLKILFVVLLLCEIIGGLWIVSFVINPFLALHNKKRVSVLRGEKAPTVKRHKVSSKMYNIKDKVRLESNFAQLHLECTQVFSLKGESFVRLQILPTYTEEFEEGEKAFSLAKRDFWISYKNIIPIVLDNIVLPDGTQLPPIRLKFGKKTTNGYQQLFLSTNVNGNISDVYELELNKPMDICINMEECYDDGTVNSVPIVVRAVTWIGGSRK